MKQSMQLILVLAVVAWCSAAWAGSIGTPYYAPEAPVVVDGDLGEWEDDYWVELDTVLSGRPEDVVWARYAVRWSTETNLIYVAVELIDTDHRFGRRAGRNRCDAIEISLDAADHRAAFGPRMGYGQHIILDAAGQWIATRSGRQVDADLVTEWAAGPVSEMRLAYEVAIVPHAFYAGWGAVDTEGRVDTDDSVEVPLDAWTWMGLDVVVNSKSRTGFGQLANNTVGEKATSGATLQAWLLVWATHNGLRPGDASGDGKVDDNDVLLLKSNYGMTEGAEWWRGDFDADGDVDLEDYAIFMQGRTLPPRSPIPAPPPPPPIDPEPEFDFSRSVFPDHGLDGVDRSTFDGRRGVGVDRAEFDDRGFDVERGF